MKRARAMPIAVFVSGSGSNLQAIFDAADRDPGFGANPVVVVSDRPGVAALDRATKRGVATRVIDWAEYSDRESFTATACDLVDQCGAELVILAGFMRILGRAAPRRFPNQILNIHPSLLPSFPGRHPIRDTLVRGVKVTGVTVHFVDELVDHGPIIAQEAVPVLADDDEVTLHRRIREVEHRLYPATIRAIAAGRVSVEGSKVVWK